jgi:inner membrane protein
VAVTDGLRSPGFKLFLAIVVGVVLTIPLFSVWLLVYDRQSQSEQASASITAGWGGPQAMAGPLLVIPYRATATETVLQNGQSVTRSNEVMRELTLAPEAIELSTAISPQVRKRSIYEAVVYDAKVSGRARFAFPPDLARTGVDPGKMDLSRAELRFGLSDPRGLGANPKVTAGGTPLRLQPGGGSGTGRGFFAWIDASALQSAAIPVEFTYDFRGNSSVTLAPAAGDTRWTVRSSWPHPSFAGDFLPSGHRVSPATESATRDSTPPIGSAISRSGDRWRAPETAAPQARSSRSVRQAGFPRHRRRWTRPALQGRCRRRRSA